MEGLGSARSGGEEPPGKHYSLYLSFVLLGVGFLMPPNAFIIAIDYFSFVFPGRNIEAVMVAVNLTLTLMLVLASVVIAKVSDVHVRIRLAYCAFAISLGTVLAIVAVLHGCGNESMYIGIILAVAVTSIGAGVQQGSMYGFASVLPVAYPQAVMTGESAAGSIVSTVRIVTKSIGDEHLRTSTLIYFGITLGALLLCVAAHTYAKRHRVISYHYHRLKTDTTVQAVEGVTERAGVCGECHSRVNSAGMHISASDMETENMDAFLTKYTKISETNTIASGQLSPTSGNTGQSHTPQDLFDGSAIVSCHTPDQLSTAGDEEEGLLKTQGTQPSLPTAAPGLESRLWTMAKDGLKARLLITKQLWKWVVVISGTYALTLILFPSLLIKVPWHSWGSWTPVVLIAVFNYADLLGKVIGPYISHVTVNKLLVVTFARVLLFPLLMLCILPCDSPYLDTQYVEVTIAISVVLGLTNGVVGTLSMSLAPKQVARKDQELAGMLMIFYCRTGLAIGAYIALGVAGYLCTGAPCIPLNMTNSTTNLMTSSPPYSLPTTIPSQSAVLTSAWQSVVATNMTSTSSLASTTTSPTALVCATTCLDSEIH